MEAFLVSAGLVALAEIGDKTQLLAFLLAAKFRKPVPIIGGIVLATLVNHGLAGALGTWVTTLLGPQLLRWVVGLAFIGMALWTLVPDRLEDDESAPAHALRWGVLGTTAIAFFLAEMGDKTQLATVALAAKFHTFAPVVAGTTLGMLIADVPAVFIGERLAHRLPVQWVRAVAAALFALLGIAALTGLGERLGI
ncbi:MAG: TMEM165/GDT1 family protein [Betaproteobacteria bacterium]|nr:TMEM165/GDT1 family protein [Betaproteobacteria bacterium]